MNRQVELKDVIELIDEQIEELKTQNGMGALISLIGLIDKDNMQDVIENNKVTINELTDLRMKVLEL